MKARLTWSNNTDGIGSESGVSRALRLIAAVDEAAWHLHRS
jgi:hypothetical protein